MKIKALLLLCLLALSCGAPRSLQKQTEIDLMGRFTLSDRSADSQFIFFGTPDSQRFLLTGWSDRQKTQGVPFLYATANKAGFIFNASRLRPLYLHLRIKSKTPNPATVFVNGQRIADLVIDNATENYAVAIPLGVVRLQTNIVELQFSGLNPVRKENQAPVAAAAFYAAITPSKYIVRTPPEPMPEFWSREFLKLNYKRTSAIQCSRGGSFYDYEPLNKNALLKFGLFYKPSQFAENDDFATYSVLLRRDGRPEKTIYTKRLTENATLNESLSLAPFVDQPGLYQIEFRLERNSMFDDSVTAWLAPTLLVDQPKTVDWSVQNAEMEALRHINSGANVVIMLLDAGGAKHFSSYNYPRSTTPVTDALATEGTRFDQAYCQAVYTLTSTASLMSGLLPVHHHVIYTRNRLSSDIFTMAEAFSASGYDTGSFVANGNASEIFGMAQGFQQADDVFRFKNYTGWGKDVTEAFERWLGRLSLNKPFFAYLHFREPHAPYNPPPEWKFKFTDPNLKGYIDDSYEARMRLSMGKGGSQVEKDYIEALYDANLNYGDYEVGQVLKRLKRKNLYDRTVVIVIADHGEAFWEHGFQGHNSQLYQESARIPMVIKLAKGSQTIKTTPNVVRTIDIYPTLVDLLGFSRKDVQTDGKTFLPFLAGGIDDQRKVMCQVIMERQYSYLADHYKFLIDLVSNDEELYNLLTDPDEKKNIVQNEPVRANYYRAQLFEILATRKNVGAYYKRAEKAEIDETARENLKALGYIDDTGAPVTAPETQHQP